MQELIHLETLSAIDIFTKGGLDALLVNIEKQVKSETLDGSTAEGRAQIKSLAHKVARTKTAIDTMGKSVTEEWKRQAKVVDAERKKAWDKLEALQAEVRKPVTEFEEREKTRIADFEAKIESIKTTGQGIDQGWQNLPLDMMQAGRDKVNKFADTDWQEFSERAGEEISRALACIDSAIAKRKRHDEDQAELEKLRQEKLAREQADREAQARKEGEEKAQREAAAQAEREKREREEAAEKERAAAAQRIKDAEEAAAREKADKERIEREAKEKAAQAAKDAAAAQQKAIDDERARVQREADAAEAARLKREANEKHRAKIDGEAIKALNNIIAEGGRDGDWAKMILQAIAAGNIPHVKIEY